MNQESDEKPQSSSVSDPATPSPASPSAAADAPPAAESSASAATGSGAPADPATLLAQELVAAKKEAAANHDRYMRAMADLENFRRRTIREKDELRQFAASRVLEDLLPVLDNLGFGLAAAQAPNATPASVVSGFALVADQFRNALSGHGLKDINPVGQAFDPNLHEAVSHLPSPDVPAEHVMNVVRIGYTLNGRLLRPATVVVSSGPAAVKDTAGGQDSAKDKETVI
ncbi:molecular chaperone GrpE [Opitutaceae bacterium TAV5]|nr:molecular chaperone GrpE [Opitutaceae bacterium TAV5]